MNFLVYDLIILGLPLTLIGISWRRIYSRRNSDTCRVFAWLASIFTVASSIGGVWGLVIVDQLAKRTRLDYGYEGRCFGLGALGLLGAIVWVIRSRNLAAALGLIASIWITTFWMLVLETL
jgi:hypothetical protein